MVPIGRLSTATACVVFLLVIPSTGLDQVKNEPDRMTFLTGEFIIKFRAGYVVEGMPAELSALGLHNMRHKLTPNLVTVRYDPNADIRLLQDQIERLPYVDRAEPNIIFFSALAWTPNDDYYVDPPDNEGQWYLKSFFGQAGPKLT